MDWTRLELGGRITAVSGNACAGVDDEGTAVITLLEPPEPPVRTVDSLVLDSFGVVGLAHDGVESRLTGRGTDGRLHLWSVGPAYDPKVRSARSLDEAGSVWAVPLGDDGLLSVASGVDGWCLDHRAVVGEGASSPPLRLGGSPDRTLSYARGPRGPLVVGGSVGRSVETAAAWALVTSEDEEPEWRRVHLSQTPTEVSSVAASADGRTWLAGRLDAAPVVHELLDLPFRGPYRTAAVGMPALALVPEALTGAGRAVVLVERARTGLPVLVAATTSGNKLCWRHPSGWKGHAVPDGRLRGATLAGGRIHVLVDDAVWSLPDPTAD